MRLLASAPLVATVAVTASSAVHAQVTTFGTVRGIVKDASGTAISGATVVLKPAGNGPALTGTTDATGAFEFQGVQAGNYNITATSGSLEKSETVSVTQDTVSSLSFSLESGTSRVTVSVAPVRRGQSNQQTNISKRAEQLIKSQPNALYQMPGLVFGQPGITPDNGGYVHINGGDYNQVGFQVDGIPITEPLGNGFATNIVTVGLKSANLLTGGADASYGNGVGFLNELTQNGRDAKGGLFEYTAGPGQGWDYNGSQIEYGNVTGNGKFDYFGATVLFSNKFPNNTQISKLGPSQDQLVKFNYYANPKDTFTLYVNSGREKYNNYELPLTGANPQYPVFDQKTGKISYTSKFFADYQDQRYDLNYVNYQHKFTDKTFTNFKIYDLFDRVQIPESGESHAYITIKNNQRGYFLDFNSQLAAANLLKFGFQLIDASSNRYQVTGIPASSSGVTANGYATNPLTAAPAAYINKPKTTTLYVNDTIRAFQDKATLDLGVRHSSMNIGLPKVDLTGYTIRPNNLIFAADGYNVPSHHSVSYTDPRLGATYSPDKSIVFRASIGQESIFPDTRRVLSIPGALTNRPGTTDPTIPANQITQVNRFLRSNVLYNPLGAQHTKSLDIGADKGFNLASIVPGSYTFGLNAFRRDSRNTLQVEVPNYANYGVFSGTLANSGRPFRFTNEGKLKSSGFSSILSKRLVKKTDTNGFISYTNLVAKGSSTRYDTGYEPYYVSYLNGTPGLTDASFRNLINSNLVPTSWDQKHTVAVVANKRIWKFFDTTAFLDAGSGFPFTGGQGSNDAQHQSFTQDGATFNNVPVVVSGNALQANNAIVGRTGWHYKFSLNSNFHVKEDTTVFLNIDNVFTRKTATVLSTSTISGDTFYHAPSAAFPQGQVYYGANTILTPRFVSFGVRTKF